MQKRFAVALSAIAFVGILAGASTSFAAWPANGVRSIEGTACTPFVNAIDNFISYCPYISDFSSDADAYYAHDNATTYIDYHVQSTASGDSTTVESCRQRWTGAAVVCGTPTFTSGTGYHDLGVYSFGTLGGESDQFDYYYLSVATTETVDVIYGVDYY